MCESGAVRNPPLPARLPEQRPRLLIYSKSLKSPYYCSSSSPSPPLPQSLSKQPSPHPKKPTRCHPTVQAQGRLWSRFRPAPRTHARRRARRGTASRFWHVKLILAECLGINVSFPEHQPRMEAARILLQRSRCIYPSKKKKDGDTFLWAVERTCA